MNISKVVAQNFGSYSHVEFVFDDSGLNLISGPTGSGKSTLCDLLPWALFGRTAKDGSVDEICKWGTKTTTAQVYFADGTSITRTRNPNDLFLFKQDTIRGKDSVDTQKLINQYLGFTIETYLAGSYYHEFSQTAQFFTLSAKNRRQLCEQIADLDETKMLQQKLQISLSDKKLELKNHENLQYEYTQKLVNLRQHISVLKEIKVNFESNRQQKLKVLNEKFTETQGKILIKQNVEDYQKRLKYIAEHSLILKKDICKTCGKPNSSDIVAKLKEEENQINRKLEYNTMYNKELKNIQLKIVEVENETCLSDDKIKDANNLIAELNKKINTLTPYLIDLKTNKTDSEVLLEILDAYRSAKITNAISQVQADTNQKLVDYFDSEIRVQFTTTTKDKVDVAITKDGNQCSYTQLSKGQRCILKLCFGTSVMQAAANQSGVTFEYLYFDEALDGMDSNMKLRAMKMIANLPQKCKYIVEHHAPDEIDFNVRYNVQLDNGSSQIEKA